MNLTTTPSAVRTGTIEETKEHLNREFGDKCVTKQKGSIRFMFQNVNGLGYSHDSVKSNSIRNMLFKHEVDIMAMAETNVNWSKLRRQNTLTHTARRWYQSSKVVISYNQRQTRTTSKHFLN